MAGRVSASKWANIPVRTLRRIVGIPANRPSARNACIGAALRDKKHPSAPAGAGGRRNVGWQQQFTAATRSCK